MKRIYEFNIKRISRFTKKNLLIVLFALFICVSVGVSAYLGSDASGVQNSWDIAITHAPTTPTLTLVPDTGWWSTVATPTPKK